jgi:hypothetical protein
MQKAIGAGTTEAIIEETTRGQEGNHRNAISKMDIVTSSE